MKFIFCLLFSLFSSVAYSYDAQKSRQLDEYLLKIDTFHFEPHLKDVMQLLKEGADPNATYFTGGNSFQIAMESFSNLDKSPKNQALIEEVESIIKYLAQEGARTDAPDYRGITPIYALLRFSSPGEVTTRMLDFLLTQKYDLNFQSQDNGISLNHLISRMGDEDLVEKLLARGLNLELISNDRDTFAHKAAKIKLKPGKKLFLEFLLNKIQASDRQRFARFAANDGSEPIHFAAFAGNLPAIKYLHETFHIPLTIKNASGDSVFSIAKNGHDEDTLQYLKSMGIEEELAGPYPITCDKENDVNVSYEFIVELINTCHLKNLTGVLRLLPARYKSNYTTAFSTLAVQDASPEYPQIVLFGRDGKLLAAFNGHKKQKGFNNLELIQFRDDTKRFEMREIIFPGNAFGKVSFSRENPIKCLACHGVTPRPLWDSWTIWPGKFKGEMDFSFPEEYRYVSEYLKNRNKGRYRFLPSQSYAPIETVIGNDNQNNSSNLKMDSLIGYLVAASAAKALVENTALKPFRYAILAALSCKEAIENFIPESVKQTYALKTDFLKVDTFTLSTQEFKNRVDLLKRLIPGVPQGRYVIQEMLWTNPFLIEQAGRSFDTFRVINLRYVLENNQFSMESWFTPFNFGKTSYSVPVVNPFEILIWKEFMKEEKDAEMLKLYSQVADKIDLSKSSTQLFYDTNLEEKMCGILKQKSLNSIVGI